MKNLRKWIACAMFSAIAVILMFFFEFALPFLPPYLKVDFGELPALVAAFVLGPLWGVLVCFIKNLVCLTTTGTAGVGELANFIIGALFVFPAGYIYKKNKTKKMAVSGCFAGIVLSTIISFFVNYYITYPFYSAVMIPYDVIVGMYSAICPWANTLVRGLLVFNLPLTFVKSIIISVVTIIVYKKISPVVKGKY